MIGKQEEMQILYIVYRGKALGVGVNKIKWKDGSLRQKQENHSQLCTIFRLYEEDPNRRRRMFIDCHYISSRIYTDTRRFCNFCALSQRIGTVTVSTRANCQADFLYKSYQQISRLLSFTNLYVDQNNTTRLLCSVCKYLYSIGFVQQDNGLDGDSVSLISRCHSLSNSSTLQLNYQLF